MLKIIRQSLALIVFICFIALIADYTGTLHAYLGWMARMQLVPALLAMNVAVVLLLILLTLLMGRIYCSVICPLGIMQDIISHFHIRLRKNRFTYSPAHPILRISFLILFVALLVIGLTSWAALLAPYSIFTRITTTLVQPLVQMGGNMLAWWSEKANNYMFYSVEVWMKSLTAVLISAIMLIILIILAWRGGRTYCNTLCPVGTLLGYISRFSLFKIRINENKCVKCGLCALNCKASCIDLSSGKIDYSRCVTCGNCLDICHTDAISFSPRTSQDKSEPDAGKRAFLTGVLMMAGGSLWAKDREKRDGKYVFIPPRNASPRDLPVLPPGAASLRHFQQHCTACLLCVSQCPNNVLRPSTRLDRLLQPEMSFDKGFCRPECTNCSDVCPTGAIRPMTRQDKSSLQKGHAVWRQDMCLVISQGIPCGNCATHCPTGAIEMTPLKSHAQSGKRIPRVPIVNEERCIGCGACEYVCPSRPDAAIYVEGHEDQRFI